MITLLNQLKVKRDAARWQLKKLGLQYSNLNFGFESIALFLEIFKNALLIKYIYNRMIVRLEKKQFFVDSNESFSATVDSLAPKKVQPQDF